DDLVLAKARAEFVEVLDEHLARVAEHPDHERLAQLEVAQHRAADLREPLERGSRVETGAREGPAREGDRVDESTVRTQGACEDGVHLGARGEDELVVGGARAARLERQGAQQDGGTEGATRGARARLDPRVSRAGGRGSAVRGPV